LAYRDLSDKLNITETVERGLQEIPLSAIVGSVGRADDFTRDFLPKRDSDAERWASVRAAVIDMRGWSPIDVYKVGDAYFVKDGNHRVSVARQLGNKTISAYVTEVESRLPLEAGDDPEAIILRANYVNFLEKTRLDQSRPKSNLELTFSNQYATLLAQIEQYRQMHDRLGKRLSFTDAAARWYDEVYFPTLQLIHEQGVVHMFPERTEADIYVLLSERRAELEEALGWELSTESAVSDLASSLAGSRSPLLSRLGTQMLKIMAPQLQDGPPPGSWRKYRVESSEEESLFKDILVSVQGTEADWQLLDNTIVVAQRENASIMAIHVLPKDKETGAEDPAIIEQTFYQRCDEAGVEGQFALETAAKNEGERLVQRAAWVDLVTTNLTFATEKQSRSKLGSGVDMLVRRCPRPILVMAGEQKADMDRALLGYDGSPKADEALYVAAYLAARWQIALTVLTVVTEHTAPDELDRARRYLESNEVNDAVYVLGQKPITETLVETVLEYNSNLLIIGGFGYRPMRHLMLGSTVNGVLAGCQIPTLICR
jgi:nucleotide-binding universal stress UspA family protein